MQLKFSLKRLRILCNYLFWYYKFLIFTWFSKDLEKQVLFVFLTEVQTKKPLIEAVVHYLKKALFANTYNSLELNNFNFKSLFSFSKTSNRPRVFLINCLIKNTPKTLKRITFKLLSVNVLLYCFIL